MKLTTKQFAMVCIVIVLITIVITGRSVSAKEQDSSGFLDFSGQSQSKDLYTNLDGEWDFFEKELLTPDEVEVRLRNGMGKGVTLPDSFQAQTGDINSFGTYSTTIKIPDAYVGKALAIHIPFQYSAYTLYVDQSEVASNGIVGEDSSTHAAVMSPRIGYFFAQSNEMLLTIQVSSFEHIRGGFENSIYFGEAATVSRKFNTNII
ncbi:hypothetical protein, partial [Sporosarcina luteola]|uniref:hypothetical protein n=1 Tax=Sporosarcina luteola TaxID=582850 RepID=UPI001C3FB504